MPATRTGIGLQSCGGVMLHTHQLAIDPAVVNRISGDGAAGAPRDTRKARTKPRAAAHFARRPGATGFFQYEVNPFLAASWRPSVLLAEPLHGLRSPVSLRPFKARTARRPVDREEQLRIEPQACVLVPSMPPSLFTNSPSFVIDPLPP